MAKKMTLDALARMVETGFRETATKKDLEHLASKEELLETREVLAQAIENLELKLTAYIGSGREEFDRLKSWMKDIDARISALEGKRHRKAT